MAVDKAVVGLVISMVSLGCLIVAFASPYWVESYQKADSRFVKAGIWEFCFNDYTFWKDYNGKIYIGCWYIFSDQYRSIWEWLSPHWFIAVQVLVSVSLLFLGLATLFLILLVVNCFPYYLKEIILLGVGFAYMAIELVQMIVMILFGVMKEDRDWVPRPDQNYLSFSYWFYVVSSLLTLMAGFCVIKAGFEQRKKLKEDYPDRGY